jgi:uncharacterized protein
MFYIEVKKTPTMGNGVFACKDFAVGEVVEVCPTVPMSEEDAKLISQTLAEYWFYEWETQTDSAMVLGYGMVYNHDPDANAEYTLDYSMRTVTIKAVKPIQTGEQIFINYNKYTPSDKPLEMFDANSGNHMVYSK